ncbi:MAG TPA: signal recognition particle protein [Alphaproteobacteria bacterium]|nr:signal recognition particle protein [Alphaproteobacteria bacterium]
MFDTLAEKLGGVFDRLARRGALTESDVDTAMREIRIALLEADVALPVVKDFVAKVREQAVGQAVIKSVTPSQMVVKIVNDALIETLGGENAELDLNAPAPVPVLMVGLQGSGKTTTSAKLALRLKKDKKRVLLASLDVYRPAAQEQLAQLGKQIDVAVLPVIAGEKPKAIAARAMAEAKKGYDVVILDTAGRLHIDLDMMAEVAEIRSLVNPHETLLVVDALAGQDAANIAREFNEKIGITGIVLTRIDGDSRGGAALSMRAVTGRPIKFLGAGEKVEALEPFHPDRLAGRILGMGDVVSLVETAAEKMDKDEAERVAKRMMDGRFDLNDLLSQLRQMQKMGDLKGLLGLIPGMGKFKAQIDAANIDDKVFKRQEAIILSMTPRERRNPDIIKASRKKRIADGCGLTVQEVNRLLKQYDQMADMMKKVKKMGKRGLFGGLPGGLGGGFGGMGGFPPFGGFPS